MYLFTDVLAVFRFRGRLFAQVPETKALFGYNGVDGVTTRLRAQGSRIFSAAKNLIAVLDNEGVLQEYLSHLRAQHADRDLKPEYYKVGQGRTDHKSNEVTE